MSTTPKSPEKVTYWPGTKIVKSLDNGFTRKPGPSLMASPAEETKARAQSNAEQARKTQIERNNGFGGHASIRGLSRKADAQLRAAPRSITIAPRGSSQTGRIKKAAI